MPKVPQAHLDARRREILAAAHICFGRDGIHGTTMRDVAAEADVSVGTLYRYFEGKGEVVRALADWARRDKEEKLEGLDRSHPLEAVIALARRLLAGLHTAEAREAARVDVRLWAEALSDDELEAMWRRNLAELQDSVTELMREGQAEGAIRDDLAAEEAARAFLALGQGTVMLRSLETDFDTDRLLGTIEGLLERGLSAESGG